MTITLKNVTEYMQSELNILVSGPAGTGKTYLLEKACKDLGWKMKYFQAAITDPFTELVGIPVPLMDERRVDFFRPREIDEAEVVFFDEVNRADPRTLNTLFELIQFRSINGEQLPNLKCVVAAMNPTDDGYVGVDDLDIALMDRFDVYLTAEPKIDFKFFNQRFNAHVAKAVKEWWDEYYKSYTTSLGRKNDAMVYISPRRMEKITAAFSAIPKKTTIRDTLPPGAVVNDDDLFRRLHAALNGEDINADKKASETDVHPSVVVALNFDSVELRSVRNRGAVKDAVLNAEGSSKRMLLNSIASSIHIVGVEKLVTDWAFALKAFSPTQKKLLTSGFNSAKKNRFSVACSDAGLRF